MTDSNKNWISWIAQIVAAGIFLIAIPGKFTGDPMAIGTFEMLGAEPWGRYVTGILEVTAVVLLLVPKPYLGKHAIGAAVGAVVFLGALVSHIAVLGINQMFYMAMAGLVATLVVLYLRKDELPL